MPKTDGLTDKERRFVEEYPIDFNATQAAIRAGYSKKSAAVIGHENLRKPKIQDALNETRKSLTERTELSEAYIVNSVIDTMERCKQAVPVLDKQGKPVMVETPDGDLAPAYAFQPAHILKGSEILGKHLGMFDGKKGVDDSDADDTVANDIRSAARDVALLLRRAVESTTGA